jgi:hypothetical protein
MITNVSKESIVGVFFQKFVHEDVSERSAKEKEKMKNL